MENVSRYFESEKRFGCRWKELEVTVALPIDSFTVRIISRFAVDLCENHIPKNLLRRLDVDKVNEFLGMTITYFPPGMIVNPKGFHVFLIRLLEKIGAYANEGAEGEDESPHLKLLYLHQCVIPSLFKGQFFL